MSACCPRCQKTLETAQVDTIQVRLCQAGRGLLLAHPDLVRILESSWHSVSEKQAEEMQFHALEGWQNETALHCPDCGKVMEKYGYMSLGAIQIDRCDSCALVWLDANELQNMLLALAKSNYHSERAMKLEREGDLDLMQDCLPPVGRTGNLWLFPGSENGPDAAVSVAIQLLRLLLK